MSIINNPLLLGATASGGGGGTGGGGINGYQISRSLRFNSADSAYLSRTPASAGNRKTWTWAGWVKRSGLDDEHVFTCSNGDTDSTYFRLYFNGSGRIALGGYSTTWRATSALFRDTSAWYHVVLSFNTPLPAPGDRIKLYVNGVEVTSYITYADIGQNAVTGIGQTAAHSIGNNLIGGGGINGYLADVHFIDGQALTPSSFGQFDSNNVWQPKAYSGSYGTNGFKLRFSDNSSATALGYDTSGNGNNWTPNNLSVTTGSGNDSLVDSPTNYGTDTGVGGEVRGNYATLNPLDRHTSITLANGNLDAQTTDANWRSVRGSIGMSSGKWYWEITIGGGAGYNVHGIGLASAALDIYPGSSAGSYGWSYNGSLLGGNSTGSGVAYGGIIAFAFNADTGRLDLYNNGTLVSGYFSGLPAGTYFPMFAVYGPSVGLAQVNFGQRPFAYTAPSGYKALCSTNLPTPTILNGATAMDVKLYTGNGSTQTISGLGFSPDLVWIKNRSAAQSNQLWDVVRGVSKRLISDSTGAEVDRTPYGLTSFDSTGFAVADTSTGAYEVNGPVGGSFSGNAQYAAWCWDAGNTTVTNTAGTITSQVRANPSAGFSVVTYTGDDTSGKTVGHGLGVAPQFFIFKKRGTTSDWTVVHSSLSSPWNNLSLKLNTTDAELGSVGTMDNVAPTSSVFRVSNIGSTGTNDAATYVAYCFAPVSGYSSFGSYTGNGSADGPFVYTGFRPRWIMTKSSIGTDSHWMILDTARDTYNLSSNELGANINAIENNLTSFLGDTDIVSNGFKLRSSNSEVNASGSTYIYAAFAEHPFALARAR